jgi:hypothetical protein
MGRTAGMFCFRESMPDNPVLESTEATESNIPENLAIKPDTEAMTWQQQKDFGDFAVSEGSYFLS